MVAIAIYDRSHIVRNTDTNHLAGFDRKGRASAVSWIYLHVSNVKIRCIWYHKAGRGTWDLRRYAVVGP